MTRHLLPVDLAGAPLAGLREPFIADLPALEPRRRVPRFATVSCSQCGQAFGARDNGFSRCSAHAHLTPVNELARRSLW